MPVFSKERADRRRSLALRLAALACAVAGGLALPAASHAEAPYLTLVEKVPQNPKDFAGHWTISDGAASNDNWGGGEHVTRHTWSSPPAQMDASGFTISMQVVAGGNSECRRVYSGTGMATNAFEFSIDPPGFDVTAESPANCAANKPLPTVSNGGSVTVRPRRHLGHGQIVELRLSGYYGPAMVYRYRVSNVPPETTNPPVAVNPPAGHPPAQGRLAATLECPGSIVISALPSLNCHIVITSWRRNTADPVEVILPEALDFHGNHANGIQLLQAAGAQEVFNWSAPYRWGMFVFACPSQSGTGANCFGSVTTPGAQSVRILVRQGSDEVPLRLTINAIQRPGTQTPAICGFTVGPAIFAKWTQTGGQGGVLGCATGNERDARRSPSGADARWAPFQGGLIVLHTSGRRAGSAFEGHGSIAARYLGMGGSGSWLGLPVSDEYDMPGGRRSDFEYGYIAWDRLTGGSIAMRDGSGSISFEPDTNRGGSDFASFPAIGDRAETCRDACAAESTCAAYTYVRPAVKGPRAMCWLKSSVPPARTEGCCISGVKR
ncbi:MAG: PAN domain-containing protein [Reyranellaceae bacterium]